LRDRVLVPVLRRFASPRATAMMLQEPTARLQAIGQA